MMGSVPVLRILSGQEPGVASGLAEPARLALLLEGAGHAVCAQVEGRTEALRTPHAPGALAWLAWIVARLCN
jgi:hypothetical protein